MFFTDNRQIYLFILFILSLQAQTLFAKPWKLILRWPSRVSKAFSSSPGNLSFTSASSCVATVEEASLRQHCDITRQAKKCSKVKMWGINQSRWTDERLWFENTDIEGQFCVAGPLEFQIIISWLAVFTIIIMLLMNLICSGKKAHWYDVKLAFVIADGLKIQVARRWFAGSH